MVLFEEEGFKCQSRYDNQIAFSLDIALLLKVLRSAVGHDADGREMQLAMRSLPCAAGGRGVVGGSGVGCGRLMWGGVGQGGALWVVS